MTVPAAPYLSVLRTLIATSLRPRENESTEKVAMYSHRILTQLLLGEKLLPGLQQNAMTRLVDLLPELHSELRNVQGGSELIAGLDQHVRITPDYVAAQPLVQAAVQHLATCPGVARKALSRQIAVIILDVQDKLHQAALAEEMQPLAEDAVAEPLNAQQKQSFRDYLRSRYIDDAEVDIVSLKAILGGGSKQTIFVGLRNNKRLPSTVVLRIDKADSPVGSTVADEFDIMKTMFDAGLPVPQPFMMETDTSIVGASFMVVSRIEGDNIGDAFDVAKPSRQFGVTLAKTLASLHQIPVEKAPKLPGANLTTRERMQQNIDEFEANWRKLNVPSIALELAYAWLKANMDLSEGRRSIVHRDVGCHNMLGKDGDLAALLDWETAVIGNPAQDLGYAYHTVIQLMPWEDFLAEYKKAGGIIPTVAEIVYYRLWRAVWIMGFQLLARSYFVSGLTTEMILAYASQYWYQRSELTLHELVNLVYQRH